MVKIKKVVVGDTCQALSALGTLHDSVSVSRTNIKHATDMPSGCWHVSLGDVDLIDFLALLASADEIVLQDKAHWTSNELKAMTLAAVRQQSHIKSVSGLSSPQWTYAPEYHRPKGRALWIFGGSITKGHGLDRPDRDCLDAHLASRIADCMVVNTSQIGSGLRRSLDILINTDIEFDDLVVLDVTIPGRIRLNQNNHIVDLSLAEAPREWIMAMTDDQIFFDHVSYLNTFVNYCRRVGCRVVFFHHMPENSLWVRCLDYYSHFPEWIWLHRVDDGNDGLHPGPETHRVWADLIYERLTRE